MGKFIFNLWDMYLHHLSQGVIEVFIISLVIALSIMILSIGIAAFLFRRGGK